MQEQLELVGEQVIKVERSGRINRSKLFVNHQILTVISREKPIVSVVTRYVNICHQNASDYLESFYEKGLVTKTKNKDYEHKKSYEFKLTPKGIELLKTLDEFVERLKKLDFEL